MPLRGPDRHEAPLVGEAGCVEQHLVLARLDVGVEALPHLLALALAQLSALAPLDDDAGDDWQLECRGPFAHALPPDPEDNIVLACCRAFHEAAEGLGYTIRPLRVTLETRLLIGSGLGSSASSIVAALAALGLGLNTYLRLLAPVMPYVTEEVWSWRFAGDGRLRSIHTSPWPTAAERRLRKRRSAQVSSVSASNTNSSSSPPGPR